MPSTEVTIIGLTEVNAMLDQAPRLLVARGFLKALRAGSNVILAEVETLTPTNKEATGGLLEQGELKESVISVITLDSKMRGGTASVGFGVNGHVALWVEYGHRLVGHKPGLRYIRDIPAYPFMRPAADASATPAIDAVAASLTATVKDYYLQKED